MDLLSWAVGLLDGEGCLLVTVRKRSKYAIPHHFPDLSIQMTASDVKALDLLERVIGIKGYRLQRRPSPRIWNTRDTVELHWHSIEQLTALKEFFGKVSFQTPKKKREFVPWMMAVNLYLRERDVAKREVRMIRYRDAIRSARHAS